MITGRKLLLTIIPLQEMDLLLYGDSILESFLGNQIGQPRAEWADIADVWPKHHGGSKSKIWCIQSDYTLHQMDFACLLNSNMSDVVAL